MTMYAGFRGKVSKMNRAGKPDDHLYSDANNIAIIMSNLFLLDCLDGCLPRHVNVVPCGNGPVLEMRHGIGRVPESKGFGMV